MEHVFIVKIGGDVTDVPARLETVLNLFSRLQGPKILVHGGGRQVNDLARQLGIPVKMHHGRRITDEETLRLTTMVYAGLINKSIVAQLQAVGCPSVGLSGADGPVITAEKRPAAPFDYGFAGDIQAINTGLLTLLLHNNLAPVLCPVTADGNGQLLNTNADTIAAETAIALADSYFPELHFLGERPGVLKDIEDDTSVISEISIDTYHRMKAEDLVQDGMIPKLDNAFRAADNGVDGVYITHFSRLPDYASGTSVVREERDEGLGIRN